jgi:hypothetical protein
MANDRKKHDAVLPEVRKPAGFGTLIAVVNLGNDARELWFQHADEPSIVRCVEIDVSTGDTGKPMTIKTKGERDR